MFDLTHKVALVTGSGRGLGFEIAQALAMAGATVLVNGRRSVQVTQAVEKIQAVGGTAEPLVFNVADETAMDTALREIKRIHGRLDILVNNVGMRDRRTIDEVEATDFEALLQVNLTAVYALSRSAATFMRAQQGGRIINMSALASAVGLSHGPSYAASKGGLEALTRMLSVSLGQGTVATLFETDQRVVGSCFHDAAILQHRDLVGAPDDGEAVGDQENRPALSPFGEVLHEL